MRRIALLLCLPLLAPGCSGGGKRRAGDAAVSAPASAPFYLSRLRIEDGTPADRRPARIPREALEGIARDALLAAGFRAGKAGRDDYRLTLQARVIYGLVGEDGIAATPGPGPAKVQWQVELKLRAPGDPTALYAFVESHAEGRFAGGDSAALRQALEGLARAAFKDVRQAARAHADVLQESTVRLIAGLADPDPALRLARVAQLGTLRAATAVPALTTRLSVETDREILLRIVGVLAEIGDARAAEALMAKADPKDRELLRAVVYALSAMGGQRVSDFLDILEAHDSPDIREMVIDARRRLGRRATP